MAATKVETPLDLHDFTDSRPSPTSTAVHVGDTESFWDMCQCWPTAGMQALELHR